ncbi:hypothetical protein Ancab_028648 [Ancistrocladus abbreviatus]
MASSRTMNMVVQKEHLQAAIMILHRRPSSDDNPRILRSSGREVNSGKKSLGLCTTEGNNGVTSSPRTRLGQQTRSPMHESIGNGCSAEAASVTDPGKSNALILILP